MYYKNIEEALKAERPNDRIVKILSNKFAVIKAAFTDGSFDEPSYVGLQNNKIYFYSTSFNYIESLPNTERRVVHFYTKELGNYCRLKTNDNRNFKQQYRRLRQLLLTKKNLQLC